jgi:hypothetical protein
MYNSSALHLRYLQRATSSLQMRLGHFQSLRHPGLFFIVPNSAVDTMQLGSMADLTALTMGIGQDKAKDKVNKGNGTIAMASAE